MTERWQPIPGFPGYEASDQGQIRSTDRWVPNKWGSKTRRRGHILKQRKRPSGHWRVNLSVGGRHMTVHVHQLVMLAFAGQAPEGQEVCHNNGNPADNRLKNLRYGTASDNMRDRVKHGVHYLARRDACPRGHAFDDENTYRPPGKPNSRRCRMCDSDNYKRRKVRRGLKSASADIVTN